MLITVSYLTCYCILCAQSAGRSGPGWGRCSASQLPRAWQCSAGLPVSGTQSQHCPGSREGRRSHTGDQGSHPSGVSVAVSQRRERKNVFFLYHLFLLEDSVWPLSLHSEIFFLLLGRKEVLGAEGSGCKKQGGLTLAVASNAHCLRKISNCSAHNHS